MDDVLIHIIGEAATDLFRQLDHQFKPDDVVSHYRIVERPRTLLRIEMRYFGG